MSDQQKSDIVLKKQILIAEDEQINRLILANMLEEKYDLLFACNGLEALELIRRYRDTLSLVLLDIIMPEMDGFEVLQHMAEENLMHIPVIVASGDNESEAECLNRGATDFIPKDNGYPPAEVVHARIRRTIELSEDRKLIGATERDSLTGLYSRDYFYLHAEGFELRNRELEMDAIVIDVNHFHTLNERYGKSYADEVLRQVANGLQEALSSTVGFACRKEADSFQLYCVHREDYRELLETVTPKIDNLEAASSRVHLRMGVYPNVDKSIDLERRFDRAKLAADTVRNNYASAIGFYDSGMHERELKNEGLIEEFREAIEHRQFKVWYQPKFDIRPDIPVMTSAEALVRWQHPTMGMISPGEFIPLFEENGLIRELDHYVWREAAKQIADWKRRLDFSVPVSVNVSRIDLYDPKLGEKLQEILQESGLKPSELLLEITESAYTRDSGQIIETVNALRGQGFMIEMDDFGTGYSSLNMISALPVDAMKLDMQFVRSAFREKKDTRLLEIIIDIAAYLNVPVIAEGVETETQLNELKKMGCDMVQGYYFSRPVPAKEYDSFLTERREQGEVPPHGAPARGTRKKSRELQDIGHALSCGFESIYYVNIQNGHYVEFGAEGSLEDLQIRGSGADFFTDVTKSIPIAVYPDDRDRLALSLERETLLTQLMGNRTFTMTYRLMEDGQPVYYSMKVVKVRTGSGQHIVIGVSNVDDALDEVFGEDLLLARQMATRDALTGVKNRHAYETMEKELNGKLSAGDPDPLAVVLCDINDLKSVNDTCGHLAGDDCIRSASRMICNTFKHSPVYRIGGDEFVALLRGSDYENRENLLREFDRINNSHVNTREAVVAYGLGELVPGQDTELAAVFKRADAAMYEHKSSIKTKK